MLAALRLALLSVLLGVGGIPSSIAVTLYALEHLTYYGPENVEAAMRVHRLWRIDTSTATATRVVDISGFSIETGGIEFDENGTLFWFGTEHLSLPGTTQAVCLYRIDTASGAATRIACPLQKRGGSGADSFAIVGRKGYTVYHEFRGQEAFAQLYEINLIDGSATQIGNGYLIPGRAPSMETRGRTIGLAADGATLYGIRGSGEIHRLDIDSGQIAATIRAGAWGHYDAAVRPFGPNLAFADDALWLVDTGSRPDVVYKIDPTGGAHAAAMEITHELGAISALTSTERRTFASIGASALNVDATRVGRTAGGDLFSRVATASASAPVRLGDAQVIKSLRCVVRDNLAQGSLTASVRRTPISTQPGGVETVVSVSTRRAAQNADPVELRATPSAALARVDNRRYGYHLQVDFAGSQIGAQTPHLYFRGCVIETR